VSDVDVRIFETADETAHALAAHVASAVRRKPKLVLGLATGRSPVAAYRELQRLHARGEVDFSRMRSVPATMPRLKTRAASICSCSESVPTGTSVSTSRVTN
jgi:hypothetical protein